MKPRLLDALLVVLVLCALTVTGLVVRREWVSSRLAAMAEANRPRTVVDWRRYGQDGHRSGPAQAPVAIVLFSDFECPYCAALVKRLERIQSKYAGQVAIVYRHAPMPAHPFAERAARASECAATQGRFDDFARAVYTQQDSIGFVPWEHFAAAAGVPDLARFRECAGATGPVAALGRDSAATRRLGVQATPTLLVNEVRLVGLVPLPTLDRYVQRVLWPLARPTATAIRY